MAVTKYIYNNQYGVVKTPSGELVFAQFLDNVEVSTGNSQTITDTIPQDVSLPALPVSGWIEKDKLYNYGGQTIQSVQGHQRTIYAPSLTPALFSFYRVNSDTLNWIENEKVLVGWKRIYNAKTYIVLQAHLTLATWNPELTLGTLWQVVASSAVWTVGVAYKVNDIVTYNSNTYKCLQAHTSQAGWAPNIVPALFQLQ